MQSWAGWHLRASERGWGLIIQLPSIQTLLVYCVFYGNPMTGGKYYIYKPSQQYTTLTINVGFFKSFVYVYNKFWICEKYHFI